MGALKGSIPWNKGRHEETPELTWERVRELVRYDPETGHLYRLQLNSMSRPGPLGLPNAKGYLRVSLDNRKVMAHRLAWFYMTGRWPPEQIDHINGNTSDNRFVNLREATNQENQLNRHAPYKSGHKLNLSDEQRKALSDRFKATRARQILESKK